MNDRDGVMRRLLCLGASIAASSMLAGCSDDPDPRRFGGTTQVAQAAGSGGIGAGGAAGSGTTTPSGGAAGMSNTALGGAAGSGATVLEPPPCVGCIEVVVPVDPAYRDSASNTPRLVAMFNFVFPAPGVDMSNATVIWRVSSLTQGADLYVTPYAQNGTPGFQGVYRPQTLLTAATGFDGSGTSWVNVELDLANTAPLGGAPADAGAMLDNGGMNKAAVEQLGLQVGALASLTQATTIRVQIDSVTFEGVDPSLTVLRNREFNAGPEDLMLNGFEVPPGTSGPTAY